MRFSLDHLFAARYTKDAIATLPSGWGTGAFWNIAGDSIPFAKGVIDKGCPFYRSAGLWADNHIYGKDDVKELKKMAKAFQAVAINNPQTRIEISCFCEHLLDKPDEYHDIVQNEAPSCHAVNTPGKVPGKSGKYSKKYKNECHGSNPIPETEYNYSYDGTNSVDADVETDKEKHKNCDAFFFWHPRFNLKWSMKDDTPREDRKAFPTREFIASIQYLATPMSNAEIKPKWLIKSHSEKHNAEDTKGDKLLIISPVKADKVMLKTIKGQTVDTLNYYGPYDGGGHRYYSKSFGYQVAAHAFNSSGTPLCQVAIKNKIYGTINPGFRFPSYRD